MASVVVIGGGIAGLVCGWRLTGAGHDVEILEQDDQAGGRAGRPDEDSEAPLARWLSTSDHNTHAVLRALGAESAIETLAPDGDAVVSAGAIDRVEFADLRSWWRSPLLSGAARWRWARLGAELLRHQRSLDPLHPELAADLDDRSGAQWLAAIAGPELSELAIAPILRALWGCELADTSGAFVLTQLRGLWRGGWPERLRGGQHGLVSALADRVPVRAGCRVTIVETEDQGASVRYRVGDRDRRVVADAAVVAVPGGQVEALCPKLTPAERGFFEKVEDTPGINVLLRIPRADSPVRVSRMAFAQPVGADLASLAVSPSGTDVSSFCVTLTAAASRRLRDSDDSEIAGFVLQRLARTPLGELAPESSQVRRWDALRPVFPPGSLPRLAAFLDRHDRSPRLAFAGDYLVGPSIEGSVTSGMRAASEVARWLA